MSIGVGQEIEESIDTLVQAFITSKSAALCDALVPLAVTGCTIYFVLVGFTVMRGEANDSLHAFVWKAFRIAFIATLALGAGQYQQFIIDGTDALVTAFIESLSGAKSVGLLVDQISKPFMDLGLQIWNQAVTGFWPNFGLIASAAGIAIIESLIFAISLGFYLLAKVALALVLALGPAYLLCAMWTSTEKYTESWIGQVLNYLVLKILVATSILMLTDYVSQYALYLSAHLETANVIRSTVALMCCSGALVVVMLNLPQLAGALSGGASISGIGRTIGRGLLDFLNKPGRQKPSLPKGGDIKPVPRPGEAGSPPSPRQPLYNRNTIERLRNLR